MATDDLVHGQGPWEREPAVTTSRSPVPQTRALMRNHTEIGPLFKIVIVNFLLTVLTLGIYRFWAKTRVRQYLWGHVEIMGDRLEYTGTGKELFLGFLFVFIVVLMPLLFVIGLLDVALRDGAEGFLVVKEVLQWLVIFFLIGVALFRARRYRLTRTYWRGIRGGQTGSAIVYAFLWLGCLLLTMVTLGLAWPACSVWIKKYEMRHTWVGDVQPDFDPRIGALYKPFFIAWVMAAIYGAAMIMIFDGIMDAFSFDPVTGQAEDPAAFLLALLGLYLGMLPIIFMFLWYRGKAYHHFISSTRFLNHGVTSGLTGLNFLWLAFGNWALNILTLGFGAPFIYKRSLNYVERLVGLNGDGDFSALLQNRQDAPSTGEGLADAFDVGAI